MSYTRRLRFGLVGVVLLVASLAAAQASLRSAYRVADHWAQLPAGIQWGGVISVDVDAKRNVWVFHRSDPPILEFDAGGKLINSFGTGMFVQPHGMTIDGDGNVWVTDAQNKGNQGQQVFKFSPEGKVLMTLGKAGAAGAGPDTFNGPADVAIAANGDIFVADGHAPMSNGRVVKFSRDGTFIRAWGKTGTGPGEFNVPHSIAIDSKGRIFVADRSNNRLQIFDQDGTFLDQWRQFGRPSGVYIDKNDVIYVADSQSNATENPGFTRGIRIGSVKDGKVMAFIQDQSPDPDKNNNAGAEGVGADANRNIYVGDVTGMEVRKYLRGSPPF